MVTLFPYRVCFGELVLTFQKDAFKHKVQERGRSTSFINAELLLSSTAKHPSSAMQTPQGRTEWKTPPRLLSDQMVNIFFQEWAPLFPVLHRPTFLTLYEEYTSSPESVTDNTSLAQLNVVFALALLSHSVRRDLLFTSVFS